MASERCSALDQNGKQCRATTNLERIQYHGDPELYGTFNEPWPGWVLATLCPRHCEIPRKKAPRAKR